MSSSYQQLVLDCHAEFVDMNNLVYPYGAMENTQASLVATLTNNGLTQINIPKDSLTLVFEGYSGIVFTPLTQEENIIIDAPDPLTQAPQSITLFFHTGSSGQIVIQTTDIGHIYNNGILVQEISVSNSNAHQSDEELIYYFCFKMTSHFAVNINSANIDDVGSDENPGAGLLHIDDSAIFTATDYALSVIMPMQRNPQSASNSHITNTIDTYLDKLTTNFFYSTVDYSYHSIRTLSSDLCDELDTFADFPYIPTEEHPTQPNSAEMTQISAVMIAEVINHYCNGALGS